ncbi:putative quinol monooxygenase [Nonomuraea soli]|uniref:Quinol monooxygenase YgiN n=1 Tax=Nonomuraea soli TaxID=1032476 RepID=A0A7W0CHK2_9ACTN|nr:antibiotic biosynthesis monooxygenase [Nonomuraea soli]MBA2891273.1 quinol monooxygenase YgiN [Nonomuraea soli]
MEILVAVLAFAGALLAVIAAGALISRLREEAEGYLIAWTVAAIALALALAAVGTGCLMGFGIVTFKIFQLGGSLLAPLWMAIGLVQLLAERVPVKFAGWLFGIALTVVASVVMVFDPLKATVTGNTLPTGGAHWAIIPGSLLFGVHVLVTLIMITCIVVAALRWRTGDEYDTDNLHAALVIAPSGLALLGALRFTVPPIFTTALLLVAGAGIWYSVLRPLAPYEDDEEDDDIDRAYAKRAVDTPAVSPRRSSSGLGDLVAEYRAGDNELAPARAESFDAGPATGMFAGGDYGSLPPEFERVSSSRTTGYGPADGAGGAGEYGATGAYGAAAGYGAGGANGAGGATGAAAGYGAGAAASGEYGRHGAPQHIPGDYRAPRTGPHAAFPAEPVAPAPATGAFYPGAEIQAAPGGSTRPSPNIFGMLTVFTLMDGSGDAFDRLADDTVEAVRRSEPDTLIYVCHGVKSAPLQRIIYELYRDEVAYADHQRQPHVVRFVNDRQAMVLATNVIELNVNAAKVMPLPTAMF